MATIGTLNVALRANTRKFNKGMDKAQSRIKMFSSSLLSLKSMAIGLGVALGGVMSAKYLKGVADGIDQTAKFADAIGISSEALQKLQHVGGLAGASAEQVNKGLQRMINTVGEASQGIGTGAKAFEDLGLSVGVLLAQTPDEQFATISEALKKMTNQTLRVTSAVDIFGRQQGTALIKMMSMGSDEIKRQGQEFQDLGVIVNRFDAELVETANDSIAKATAVFSGLSNVLVAKLAPSITMITDKFTEWAKQANVGQILKDSLDRVMIGFGTLLDTVRVFALQTKIIFNELSSVILKGISEAMLTIIPIWERITGKVMVGSRQMQMAINNMGMMATVSKIGAENQLRLMDENKFENQVRTFITGLNEASKARDALVASGATSNKGLFESMLGIITPTLNKANNGIISMFTTAQNKLKELQSSASKSGDEIRQALKKPIDFLNDDIKKAMEALSFGDITKDQFDEFINKRKAELFPDSKDGGGGGAFEQIDFSLVSTDALAMQASTQKVQNDQLNVQKEMLAEAIAQTNALQNINLGSSRVVA